MGGQSIGKVMMTLGSKVKMPSITGVRAKLKKLKMKKNKTKADKAKIEKLEQDVNKLNEIEDMKNRMKRTGQKKENVSLVDTSDIEGMNKGGIAASSIKSKGQLQSLLNKGKLDHLSNDKVFQLMMKFKMLGKGDLDMMSGKAKGGMMMKKKNGMAMGGLKKPAASQTGLKKLPQSARNNMGYMMGGGMGKKSYGTKYNVGGAVKGKAYGSIDNRKKK